MRSLSRLAARHRCVSCFRRRGAAPDRLVAGVVLGLVLVAGACGGADATGTDRNTVPGESTSAPDLPEGTIETWVNQTGLTTAGDARSVWTERLQEACAAPVWDSAAARDLATRYVAEDGGDPSDVNTVENAATALWQMAVTVCREDFPPDALERGPVFVLGD